MRLRLGQTILMQLCSVTSPTGEESQHALVSAIAKGGLHISRKFWCHVTKQEKKEPVRAR